jgi:hypothetical protein
MRFRLLVALWTADCGKFKSIADKNEIEINNKRRNGVLIITPKKSRV